MKTIVVFLVALWLGLISVCAASAPPDGKSLTKMSCADCHEIKRSCPALGRRDKGEWLDTVDRMIGYGLDLNSKQAEAVAEYLAKAPEGDPDICE